MGDHMGDTMGDNIRVDGRALDELRAISFEFNVQKHASGSVLIKWGDTHVLCSAWLESGTPSFVEEGGVGKR